MGDDTGSELPRDLDGPIRRPVIEHDNIIRPCDGLQASREDDFLIEGQYQD